MIKRKLSKPILLVLALILISTYFCACAKPEETVVSHTYTDKNVRFMQNDRSTPHVWIRLNCVETENAVYHFDKVLTAEQCDLFVHNAEKVLNYATSNKKNIYVFADETQYYLSTTSIIIYSEVLDTQFAHNVLQANYGSKANYGLMYGLANYIANKLGWQHIIANNPPKIINNELYDMSALCFNEPFATAEQIEQCKQLAVFFTNKYVRKNGLSNYLQLLDDSINNQPAFNEKLGNWYKQRKIEFTPLPISFALSTEYQYVVYTPYATFYMGKDWIDINSGAWPEMAFGAKMDGTFLHGSYIDIRNYFSTITTEMKQYQDFFAFENYDNSLKVYFMNGLPYSYYTDISHTVYCHTLRSFAHEYVHSITCNNCIDERWVIEGIATAYMRQYDFYGVELTNYVTYLYSDEKYSDQFDYQYEKHWREKLGRPLDYAIDNGVYADLLTYCYKLYENFEGEAYFPGASLINYLYKTYGREATFNYIFAEELTNVDGKEFPQLVEEWQAWLFDEYGEYKRIKWKSISALTHIKGKTMEIIKLSSKTKEYNTQGIQLLRDAFPHSYSANAEEEMKRITSAGRFTLGAVSEAKLLGFVGAIPQYGTTAWELHPLVVSKNEQLKGIGSALCLALETVLKKKGCLTIYLGSDDEFGSTTLSNTDLFTGTYEKIANICNLKRHPYEFYQKIGYKIVGVIPNANGIGKPDIWLAKSLI